MKILAVCLIVNGSFMMATHNVGPWFMFGLANVIVWSWFLGYHESPLA